MRTPECDVHDPGTRGGGACTRIGIEGALLLRLERSNAESEKYKSDYIQR